jgi:alpha-L-fucosidase
MKNRQVGIALVCLIIAASTTLAAEPPEPFGPVPTKGQMVWHQSEMIGLICFGLNTYTDQEWGYGDIPASRFNPSDLDAEQWVVACKAAGMQGLVLVAKHHDGFCLWPSKYTDYSVETSPWKDGQGDILRDLADACEKHGLRLGVYISPWDRNHAEYGREEYVEYFHDQWREVMTDYGPLFELWFDGANGGSGYYGGANEPRSIDAKSYYRFPEILEMTRELQGDIVMFGSGEHGSARWVGNESGIAGETNWCRFPLVGFANSIDRGIRGVGVEDGPEWMPAESDTPFRKGWYWHPNEDPKPLKHLVDVYFASVGRNSLLNFGIAPDKTGLLEQEDVDRLHELGAYLDEMYAIDFTEGRPVIASQTRGDDPQFAASNITDDDYDTYWATNNDTTTGSFEIDLGRPCTFNVVEVQEYVPLGQRVKAWAVDAEIDGAWQEIGTATTIGYKRLLRVPDTTTSRVRIRITDSLASPTINHVGLYKAPVIQQDPESTQNIPSAVPKDKWKIVDCSFVNEEDAPVPRLIDGDLSTMWHTHGPDGRVTPPHEVVLDLGEETNLTGFYCMPRHDGCRVGLVDQYAVYISDDSETWGDPIAEGEFSNVENNPVMQIVPFDETARARFVKFVAKHAVEGNTCVAICELGLISE